MVDQAERRPIQTDSIQSERRYIDGTLVLETTFRTPTGVAVLTEAMATGEDPDPHRIGRAAPHLLVRRVECTEGSVEIEIRFAPRPEYGLVVPLLGGVPGGVAVHGGSDQLVLSSSIELEVDGLRGRCHRAAASEGTASRLRPAPRLARRGGAANLDLGGTGGRARQHRRGVAGVVGRPPVVPGAVDGPRARQRARAAGAVLPAHRRHRRRGHDLAARRRRRRAQLGLPLLLGPGLLLHDAGALGRRLPRRGDRLLLLPDQRRGHGRPDARAADHVRRRRGARPHRADPAAPGGLARTAGRCGSATARGTSSRSTSTASCSAPPTSCATTSRASTTTTRRLPGGLRRRGRRPVAGGRPGHLGGARRARALPVLEGHVLGRARPGHRDGRPAAAPRTASTAGSARGTRSAQTVSRGGWSETAGAFTQSFGSDELDASNLMMADRRLPARRPIRGCSPPSTRSTNG